MEYTWFKISKISKNPLKFLILSSKQHLVPMFSAFSTVIIASGLYAFIPYIFKNIVNSGIALGTGGDYRAFVLATATYVVVTLVAHILYRISGYMGATWISGVRATGREFLTTYVMLHSRSFFQDHFSGSINNKISNASNGIREMGGNILWQFTSFAVGVVGSIVVASTVSYLIASIFLAWIIVGLVFNYYCMRKRLPISIVAHASESVLTGATVDLLGNIGAMQDFARSDFESERINKLIYRRHVLGLRNVFFGENILLINSIIQAIFASCVVGVATYLTYIGVLSVGDIVLVITTVFNLEDRMLFLGTHLNEFGETYGNVAEGLEEVLDPHGIVDHPLAQTLTIREGAIAFEHVTFVYQSAEREVMRDFSLTIPAHQKVGLVGRSGAGKSTFVKLLLRHHDINAGAITIDGQNIAEVTQDSLRAHIAVVPQESALFHRSLRENIAYGKPNASEEEIIAASKAASAHEFIEMLPLGYDTLVGERGVKLSGGERQRVAIARAILKNAPILLLDEATASLDSESEHKIQDALHLLMQGKTVIAIAHRLSTLREMDRIIVVDDGTIAEEGTHNDLIKRGGIYAGLWKHQAGGFLQDEE